MKKESFAIGGMVMLHKPAVPRGHSCKFHRMWENPYRVVRVLGSTELYTPQEERGSELQSLETSIWFKCATIFEFW